jgi:hypothetical protein
MAKDTDTIQGLVFFMQTRMKPVTWKLKVKVGESQQSLSMEMHILQPLPGNDM